MFITTKVHLQALGELAAERAKRELLQRQVDSQQVLLDFLCAQINQLGKERALLLRQTTRIDFPVPEFKAPLRTPAENIDAMKALSMASSIFADSDTEQLQVVD
jgi:hypothetical protein